MPRLIKSTVKSVEYEIAGKYCLIMHLIQQLNSARVKCSVSTGLENSFFGSGTIMSGDFAANTILLMRSSIHFHQNSADLTFHTKCTKDVLKPNTPGGRGCLQANQWLRPRLHGS